MTQWYYTNGRSKHGPMDEAGIRLRAQKGYVRPDTLLWHAGLSGWTAASDLGFFPDDDVEPTLCAIPGDPPPIPNEPKARPVPVPTVAPDPPIPSVSEPRPVAPAPVQPVDDAEKPDEPVLPVAPTVPIQVSVNAPAAADGEKPVSVGNWFWTFFLMCIPFVNVILVFVWAFGEGASVSKQNWAKAILLWILVFIGLTILFWGAVIGSFTR